MTVEYEVGLVRAPVCEVCGEAMLGYDAVSWACVNDRDPCPRAYASVVLEGLYPFYVVTEEDEVADRLSECDAADVLGALDEGE